MASVCSPRPSSGRLRFTFAVYDRHGARQITSAPETTETKSPILFHQEVRWTQAIRVVSRDEGTQRPMRTARWHSTQHGMVPVPVQWTIGRTLEKCGQMAHLGFTASQRRDVRLLNVGQIAHSPLPSTLSSMSGFSARDDSTIGLHESFREDDRSQRDISAPPMTQNRMGTSTRPIRHYVSRLQQTQPLAGRGGARSAFATND